MGLGEIYRKTGEPIIATYDWQDLADGTGIITFYGKRLHDGSDYIYSLLRNDSIVSYSSENSTGGSLDLNFETTFSKSMTVKGTAYLSCEVVIAEDKEAYKISGQVQKYDGSAETNISAVVEAPTQTAGVDFHRKAYSIKIPITTETKFSKGDILRFNIIVTRTVGSHEASLYHSPTNPCLIQIPFKIDE